MHLEDFYLNGGLFFWDIFIARSNEKHSKTVAAYIESQQMKARDQQLQMQQFQLMQQRNAQLRRRDPNHPSLAGPMNAMNSEGVAHQPSASVLQMKMYEERMKHPHSMDSDTSSSLMDANRSSLLKTATNHQGQLVHSNSGSVSPALRQIQGRPQMATEIKTEASLGPNQISILHQSMGKQFYSQNLDLEVQKVSVSKPCISAVNPNDDALKKSEQGEGESSYGNRVESEVKNDFDLGVADSSGEKNFDFESRERVTRESTPCSFVRDVNVATPSSSTRQRLSIEANYTPHNAILRYMPSPSEVEEFFARQEQQALRQFIERYSFDIVAYMPLPGRYEWVKVSE